MSSSSVSPPPLPRQTNKTKKKPNNNNKYSDTQMGDFIFPSVQLKEGSEVSDLAENDLSVTNCRQAPGFTI